MSLRSYFDRAAPRYADLIEPAYAPLAEALVRDAAIQPGERVIDLGTGSGLAARQALRFTPFVVGVDFSAAMVRVAIRQGALNVLQGDNHRLPFRSDYFQVALAALAYNSTNPLVALRETNRVLMPEGRLILYEWGMADPLSELVAETVAGYAVDEPPPDLADLREQMETPVPWDELEDLDELVEVIEQAGFRDVKLDVFPFKIWLSSVKAFINYKLAWPVRRAEIDAMPEQVRSLCLSDLQENLEAHIEADGSLIWEPEIVRIQAEI